MVTKLNSETQEVLNAIVKHVKAQDLVKMVEAFHVKHRLAVRTAKLGTTSEVLKQLWPHLVAMTQQLRQSAIHTNNEDERRVWLIMEEFAELLDAMLKGDEAKMLDALADILYCVFAVAVTHDLPIIEAFCLVHRSNMTKQTVEQGELVKGVAAKGPEYIRADIEGCLQEYKSRKEVPVCSVCDIPSVDCNEHEQQ